MARRDYLDDPAAPAPNSIAVACSAFVQDSAGSILLIHRTDNNRYSIPGGQLEPGETLSQCVTREVLEETGISVKVIGLVGLFSNPRHVIAYDDGEVRQEFSICFRAKPIGGALRGSDESDAVLWVDPQKIPELNIHPSTRLRIEHALLGGQIDPFFT